MLLRKSMTCSTVARLNRIIPKYHPGLVEMSKAIPQTKRALKLKVVRKIILVVNTTSNDCKPKCDIDSKSSKDVKTNTNTDSSTSSAGASSLADKIDAFVKEH